MTLYETIFVRRSARKYDMTPLDGAVLAELRAFLDATKPLDGVGISGQARFEIAGAEKVKRAVAPHYILAYCKTNDAAFANVGFIMQRADLFLQSKGYGCCWQGMAKPNEPDDDYCILLAFGKTDVPKRGSAAEFDRLPLGEVCGVSAEKAEFSQVAQAARLAPSAVNSQPWKIEFSADKITVRYFGRGLFKQMLKKKMSKIDLGIVTRHIVTALEHDGKTVKSATPLTTDKDLAIEVMYK